MPYGVVATDVAEAESCVTPGRLVYRLVLEDAGQEIGVVSMSDALPVDADRFTLTDTVEARVRAEDVCQAVEPLGPDASIALIAPSGASLYVASELPGEGTVTVSLTGSFADDGVPFGTSPPEPSRIDLPD